MNARTKRLNLVFTSKGPVNHPLHEWLEDVADRTIVIGSRAAREQTPDAVADHFAGWCTSPDYAGAVTELLAAGLVADFAVGAAAAISEYDVFRVARLRALGGMPGQSAESALRYRDKWLMKCAAREGGVPVPRMARADSGAALREAAERFGLPVVVKPSRMASSEGVRLVADEAELADCAAGLDAGLAAGTAPPTLVEEFVDAPLFHVDGLMRSGEIVMALASEYIRPPLDFVRAARVRGSAVLDADDPRSPALVAAARRTVAALGSPEHVLSFHAEFFLPAGREPVLCEIGCRTGGGGITPMVEAVTGVNLRRESVRGQLGLDGSAPSSERRTSSGFVVVPPGEGTLVRAPDRMPFDWVVAGSIHGRPGARPGRARKLTDHVLLAAVVGRDRRQVRERIDALAAWWHENTLWEATC
ncbi:MAG TPA: hypothetical protein VFU73_09620 [Actinocrinis sp.]|nr:hypothetical protein [Actinocrinis sp.]